MAENSNSSSILTNKDQNFIYLAFQKILGRAPDQENIDYFLARLRVGESKIQILLQLQSLRKGNIYTSDLTELNTVIKKYNISQHPLAGWIFRKIGGANLKIQIEQQLKIIENNIFPKIVRDRKNSNKIAALGSESSRFLAKLNHNTADRRDNEMAINIDNSFSIFDPSNRSSRITKNIYCKLKFASAAHKERAE